MVGGGGIEMSLEAKGSELGSSAGASAGLLVTGHVPSLSRIHKIYLVDHWWGLNGITDRKRLIQQLHSSTRAATLCSLEDTELPVGGPGRVAQVRVGVLC